MMKGEITTTLTLLKCVERVDITYRPRSVAEEKKIRPRDGLRALWVILRDWIGDD